MTGVPFTPPLFSGLLFRVQARRLSAIHRLLHVCPSEDVAQPVSIAYQAARRLCVHAQLDLGQNGTYTPCFNHESPHQRQVNLTLPTGRCCAVSHERTGSRNRQNRKTQNPLNQTTGFPIVFWFTLVGLDRPSVETCHRRCIKEAQKHLFR